MTMWKTKEYRNVFAETGIGKEAVDNRLQEIIRFYFHGAEDERVYYPVGQDMAYIMDTGNLDVRTEGMSYGMMLCVQLDKKKEFDCLWKWAKTYMYMAEGENEGYFAWSCAVDGTKCLRTGTGWRRILCDGVVFCISQMGRWRRHLCL